MGPRKHVLGGVKVGRIHSPPRGVTGGDAAFRQKFFDHLQYFGRVSVCLTFVVAATVATVCGGTLVASNKAGQLFSHAKYGDNNYDNKEHCEWLILADDQGYRVRLRFLTFEIEDERDCG